MSLFDSNETLAQSSGFAGLCPYERQPENKISAAKKTKNNFCKTIQRIQFSLIKNNLVHNSTKQFKTQNKKTNLLKVYYSFIF